MRLYRVGIIVLLIGTSLVPSSCKKGEPRPDVFLFINDVSAPNVIRDGDKFMLKFGASSAAESTITKKFDITFTYTQLDPTAKNFQGKPCDPSNITNSGNDCDRETSRKVTVTSDPVAPGAKWATTIRVGEDTPGKTCTVSTNCRGTAIITFTNGQSNKQTMTIYWPQTQNGDPNTLTIKCCK